MNRALIILIALCTLTTAFAPRDKRAAQKCAAQTPCGWSIYKPSVKIIEVNITNAYCVCKEGTVCQVDADDPNANAYIYRCKKPTAEQGSILV